MCGINGIINKNFKKVKEEQIIRMNEKLSHRGPDDNGFFIDNNIALGHTRLSILDLSKNGHQPMEYNNVVISYNGEVYNFKEIRNKLKKQGFSFISESDTEVLLKAYVFYGIDFVKELDGMFAFIIYDKNLNKIFIVRDRFGIKPLYIYEHKDKMVISSEIKAILENKGLSLTLNTEALKQYLALLYIPNPDTPFNEIRKIKPSKIYEIDLSNFTIKNYNYYKINLQRDYYTDKKSILMNIDQLLLKSVEKRMISDVEVGSFLSGGVDSSLITAMATQMTSKRFKTFSIGYKGLNSYMDETEYAIAVSKQYNTDHKVLNISVGDIFKDIENIVYMMDEPIADSSVFLNYYLSKLVKQDVSVALSGLGADEIFGGYNRYQAYMLYKKIKFFPKSFLLKLLDNFNDDRSNLVGNRIRQVKKLLSSIKEDESATYEYMINYNSKIKLTNKPNIDDFRSILLYDIQYYMQDDLLNLSDKMSMAHSLELRVPFLNYHLVDYAINIDAKFKINTFEKKLILKQLAQKYLPKNIIFRRKQGFAAPISIVFKKLGLEEIKKMIDFDLLSKIIQKEKVQQDVYNLFENKDRSNQVYSYIILSIWYKIFKDYLNENE